MNDPANATHTDQERILSALDRELKDPGAWDWDTPVELTAAPNRTLTLTVRLSRDDARLLGEGAENAGMKLSDTSCGRQSWSRWSSFSWTAPYVASRTGDLLRRRACPHAVGAA